MSMLKKRMEEIIPPFREEVGNIRKNHGDKKLCDVTVAQAYGGMRGVKVMITETSALDPEEGIRFRGYTIPELQEKLPRATEGEEPLPEGLFYLLMTGELPTEENVAELTKEWQDRGTLPEHVYKVIDALPKDTHPMTQFSAGIVAQQTESQFAAEYREGMNKMDYWKPTYEDTMNLLARLPALAAYIYRRTYKDGSIIPADPSLDWGGNLAHMMGFDTKMFRELMRIYLTIHADHEGGNVSAHTTHLVGSTLSDVYYSLAAGMNGLAGPLHGLANQEVLRWIMDVKEKLGGGVPTMDELKKFVWDTLAGGNVVPGYGHAVLRKTDPRYSAQREFALKHMPEDELFQVVSMLYEVVPPILLEQGKAKNPWPNVDAHSGVLLVHNGMHEYDFYTVLFGVSRAMGVLASTVWDRAVGLPLERPKSLTTEFIKSIL